MSFNAIRENKFLAKISGFTVLLSEIYSLNLRSSGNELIHIPMSRTTLFDNSFTCSAAKQVNALPQTVRASGSLVTFKKNLKHCFNS